MEKDSVGTVEEGTELFNEFIIAIKEHRDKLEKGHVLMEQELELANQKIDVYKNLFTDIQKKMDLLRVPGQERDGLKNCPFCGSNATVVEDLDSSEGEDCLVTYYTVACCNTFCIGSDTEAVYLRPELAIKAWNRRVK